MRYQAILFDLDGTLIDSITLWGQAIIETFRGIGIEVSKETYRGWYVQGLHLKHWLKIFNLTEADVPDFRAKRDARYMQLLHDAIAWYPDAEPLLKLLRGKAPVGLVTGSHRAYVDASERQLHLMQYFDVTITEEEMGKFFKPHPHGLLVACDRLGVDHRQCIYIGDQLFDVEACKRCGMHSCLIEREYTPPQALEQADTVIRSLDEVPKIVGL